jgi:hypothetical protein
MNVEEQQLYGQMWIEHIDRKSDNLGFEYRQHSTSANQEAEAQQWISASLKYQFIQSSSSVCSSASTLSASTLSSAPSISTTSIDPFGRGSTPSFDLRGHSSFATTDSAVEIHYPALEPGTPSTFWVGTWNSMHNDANFPCFGLPSTCWVGPSPWESLGEEIELEEYSLGSGYQESREIH